MLPTVTQFIVILSLIGLPDSRAEFFHKCDLNSEFCVDNLKENEAPKSVQTIDDVIKFLRKYKYLTITEKVHTAVVNHCKTNDCMDVENHAKVHETMKEHCEKEKKYSRQKRQLMEGKGNPAMPRAAFELTHKKVSVRIVKEIEVNDCNYTQALCSFQEAFHINETCEVDNATRQIMNQYRCGNSDENMIKKTENTIKKIPDKALQATKSALKKTKREIREQVRMIIREKRAERVQNSLVKSPFLSRLHARRKRTTQDLIKLKCPQNSQTRVYNCKWGLSITEIGHMALGFAYLLIKEILEDAKKRWEEVIPVTLVYTTNVNEAHMIFKFLSPSAHISQCEKDFSNNDVAHATTHNTNNEGVSVSEIHFNMNKQYALHRGGHGINLHCTAIHEIGHSLSLDHTSDDNSIMHPGANPCTQGDTGIMKKDIITATGIWGTCNGTFDEVFDWVRPVQGAWKFNTYFFKSSLYWMYNNTLLRARAGDPSNTAANWFKYKDSNIGEYCSRIVSLVHIWYVQDRKIRDQTFIFCAGEMVVEYNSTIDRTVGNWSRVRDTFEGVNLTNFDAVFFDVREIVLYFFKGHNVIVYDLTEKSVIRSMAINEAFPPINSTRNMLINVDNPSDHVDAAYFSYKHRQMFFFKGEDVYINVKFNPYLAYPRDYDFQKKQTELNGVVKFGSRERKWGTICKIPEK